MCDLHDAMFTSNGLLMILMYEIILADPTAMYADMHLYFYNLFFTQDVMVA